MWLDGFPTSSRQLNMPLPPVWSSAGQPAGGAFSWLKLVDERTSAPGTPKGRNFNDS